MILQKTFEKKCTIGFVQRLFSFGIIIPFTILGFFDDQ